MHIDNSYARLPETFFERITPVPVESPHLIRFNSELATILNLQLPEGENELAKIFSGNIIPDWAEPIAQAYAGHQFGSFVPQLGDGRAILLGEVVTPDGNRFDIQLKGSGITRFSRNGDGRSPLGPVIREYIVSESMHALGIPTTRTLAMVTTGETVRREEIQPSAILTRVASSHIRVGTFEFFAARKDEESVKQLADYVINRHYPKAAQAQNPYASLYEQVCHAHAQLVAQWMSVGFIHGVMNTDNTTISGETIDFGPCAFMDNYNPAQVFSSIDYQGRYAYNNQPTIAQWNLACFGGCLIPLLHDEVEKARQIGETILESFTPVFKTHYQGDMCRKIGLDSKKESSFGLVKKLLKLMHQDNVDFTMAFRLLSDAALSEDRTTPFVELFTSHKNIHHWLSDWRAKLELQNKLNSAVRQDMQMVNPAFIPRNHRVEEAIRAAEDHGNFEPTHRLIDLLRTPYTDQPNNTSFMSPPKSKERVQQTFCGT